MGLSCGSRVAKGILFVFNIVFWLAGAGLLGVGIWFLVDSDAGNYLDIATTDKDDDSVMAAAGVLVVVGVVMFITGGLGCCGAIKESGCMLTTYAVLLCMLLILQLAAGIMAVVFKDEILDGLEESMNKTVTVKFDQPENEAVTNSWKFMQYELKCCGAQGPQDWKDSAWHKNQNATTKRVVPATCCVLENDDYEKPEPDVKDWVKCEAAVETPNKEFLHSDGCHDALQSWVEDHAGILIGLAFGLLIIQIIGIVLACVLKKSIASEYNTV